MKKFATLLAAIATMLCATTLVSCGNDEEGGDTPTKAEVANVVIEYIVTASKPAAGALHITDAADVTIHYTDASGEKTATVKDGTATVKVTKNTFPYEADAYVELTLKKDADIDPAATYYNGFMFERKVTTTYKNSKTGIVSKTNQCANSVKGEKLAELLSIEPRADHYVFKLDKDGLTEYQQSTAQ